MTAHWGLPDPAAATGSEGERALAFAQTYGALANRLGAFVNLPIASLDRLLGGEPEPDEHDADLHDLERQEGSFAVALDGLVATGTSTRSAICASPPIGPLRKRCVHGVSCGQPRLQAISFRRWPVVPVATRRPKRERSS